MMGHTHALTGAAAWLAIAPTLNTGRAAELVGGTIAAAGAALLPDLDHPSATAARAWGPITRVAARAVAWATGGHRAGTHTLLAAGVAAVTVWAGLRATGWAPLVVIALLTGLALVAWDDLVPGRWERLWPANLTASAGFAWWAVDYGLDLSWLPAAVAVGWVVHIAGDTITDGGTPLLAPFVRRRIRLTALDTGGWWETGFAWAAAAAVAALIAATWSVFPGPWTAALG